jgi:hypothetical protein
VIKRFASRHAVGADRNLLITGGRGGAGVGVGVGAGGSG